MGVSMTQVIRDQHHRDCETHLSHIVGQSSDVHIRFERASHSLHSAFFCDFYLQNPWKWSLPHRRHQKANGRHAGLGANRPDGGRSASVRNGDPPAGRRLTTESVHRSIDLVHDRWTSPEPLQYRDQKICAPAVDTGTRVVRGPRTC
jgi:hypothetical protein